MDNSNSYSAVEYLESNLNYYDTKAISNKKWYTTLIIIDTTISALIPFTTLFIDMFSTVKYLIAFMGSVATILSSLKAALGFHKNWIEYRTTEEMLKFHRYLYETNSSPYDTQEREKILISNVHTIVETENRHWRSALLNNKKPTRDQ